MYNDGQLISRKKEKNEAKEEKEEGGITFRQIVTSHCSFMLFIIKIETDYNHGTQLFLETAARPQSRPL